jgi:hypothetical protein
MSIDRCDCWSWLAYGTCIARRQGTEIGATGQLSSHRSRVGDAQKPTTTALDQQGDASDVERKKKPKKRFKK